MTTLDSLLAAAQYRLRLLDSVEMVQWADGLLTRGVYTYSLGELATGAAFRAPHEWFLAALKELSVTVPEEKVAADMVLSRWIEDIAERREGPHPAIERFGEKALPLHWHEPTNGVLSNYPAYKKLVGFYYEYDEKFASGLTDYYTAEALAASKVDWCARVVAFAEEWVTQRHGDAFLGFDWAASGGTAVDIARAICEERRHEDLPVLADALEEAGFTNTDVLEHCRRAEEHPGGCWVLDLILGKDGTDAAGDK